MSFQELFLYNLHMTKAVKNKILYQLKYLKSIGYGYHKSIKLYNNEISPNSLPNDINILKDFVENCYLCELSKCRHNVLFGQGNVNSSVMFICDEPTESEDQFKNFFAGKAGETLSKMIENVLSLKKEDVYITSLVKCKSSNGMNASHFSSCNTYLFKQIELIKPKLIVTLGEKAYQFLSNDISSLNKVRGQVISFKEYSLLPTFSVKYLLRNPSSKKEAYYDMLKIKSILELN